MYTGSLAKPARAGAAAGTAPLISTASQLSEMGGAPRHPAPWNHLFVWVRIVKPSGCHCTDALGGTEYRRVPTPLRSTSPLS